MTNGNIRLKRILGREDEERFASLLRDDYPHEDWTVEKVIRLRKKTESSPVAVVAPMDWMLIDDVETGEPIGAVMCCQGEDGTSVVRITSNALERFCVHMSESGRPPVDSVLCPDAKLGSELPNKLKSLGFAATGKIGAPVVAYRFERKTQNEHSER